MNGAAQQAIPVHPQGPNRYPYHPGSQANTGGFQSGIPYVAVQTFTVWYANQQGPGNQAQCGPVNPQMAANQPPSPGWQVPNGSI